MNVVAERVGGLQNKEDLEREEGPARSKTMECEKGKWLRKDV